LIDEQLDVFMKAIADEIWHNFFYTELPTGLRRGEICGLKWVDFDEVNGTLNVRRTVHVEKGGKCTAWDTKANADSRTITLPSSTAKVLRTRKKSTLSDWIFPDPLKPEAPASPSSAYSHRKTLSRKARLPSIPFHALRHTFAAHTLTSGIDVKTLSGILVHTRAGVTRSVRV